MGYKIVIFIYFCSAKLCAQHVQKTLDQYELYNNKNELYLHNIRDIDTGIYIFIGNTNCISCINEISKIVKNIKINIRFLIHYSGSMLDNKLTYAMYSKYIDTSHIYLYKSIADPFSYHEDKFFYIFNTYASPSMLIQRGNHIDTLAYHTLFFKTGKLKDNVIKKILHTVQ